MPSMQHRVVWHSEQDIPCFSAMPSAVDLHHDRSGSTCTSTSNPIQPSSRYIVCWAFLQTPKHEFRISAWYSCLLASHHWRNRKNYIILSFDIVWIYLYDTQVTLQRHLLLFWASPSQLRVPRQGYKSQGVEVISKLFIAIWHCSHVSGQIKSDFELQKAEKGAQFPCFKVMPSAITKKIGQRNLYCECWGLPGPKANIGEASTRLKNASQRHWSPGLLISKCQNDRGNTFKTIHSFVCTC